MPPADKRKERMVTAKERLAKHSTGFDRTSLKIPEGTNLFLPKKPGSYRLEILPYRVGKGNPVAEEGKLYYERTFFVHRGIGPNSDTYVCPAKTAKKQCPICEHRAKLAQDPDADEKLVKDLAPKERQLFLIYDHADADRGVQLWDVSFHIFGKHLDKKIQNADDDDRDAYENFADSEDGMTVKVGASEESYGAGKFLEFADIEFKPRKTQLDPELFDHGVCLDDCVKMLGYDELKKILLQTGDSESEDEEDDPKPKKKAAKPADDEDDEPAPKPKAKKPPVKEEDEDEEPAPKKKTKQIQDEDDADDDPSAESLGFEVGDEVIHEDHGKCRIVHVSGDGSSIRIKDEDGEVHKAIAPKELKKAAAKKPTGKKPAAEDDEDEEPAPKPKKKPVVEDEDDEDDGPRRPGKR